jgi:Holliday junction resolvasome RuvABC endonuclease subunit
MAVIGLDPSITSTGLALVQDGQVIELGNTKSTGKKGASYDDWLARIDKVHRQTRVTLSDWLDQHVIDLAVIEAPSHGSKFGNPHERAGLWWRLYKDLSSWGISIKTLAPKSRAKYITGNGNADKTEVLAAARERWGEIPNHDLADAVGLAMWGEENDG